MEFDWIEIDGRNPDPAPPLNTPVLVVRCSWAKPVTEVMSWTGTGWSYGHCQDGHNRQYRWMCSCIDGDDIFYWAPLPEPPHKSIRDLLAEANKRRMSLLFDGDTNGKPGTRD